MDRGKTANAVIRASSCLAALASLLVLSAAAWPAAANRVAAPATQREQNGKAVILTKGATRDGYTIVEQNKLFLFRAINVRDPVTGKPLEGKHKVEIVCDKIPYLTNLFFNKGNSETRSKCLVVLVRPRIIIQEEE